MIAYCLMPGIRLMLLGALFHLRKARRACDQIRGLRIEESNARRTQWPNRQRDAREPLKNDDEKNLALHYSSSFGELSLFDHGQVEEARKNNPNSTAIDNCRFNLFFLAKPIVKRSSCILMILAACIHTSVGPYAGLLAKEPSVKVSLFA